MIATDGGTDRERSSDPASSTAETQVAATDPDPIDSRWWYWVAAVPLYVVVSILAVGIVIASLGVGVLIDLGGGMGVGSLLAVLVSIAVIGFVALGGLALLVMFPIGIYLDAKTIANAEAIEWSPDPVLYAIVAVASIVFTVYFLSLAVSIYYLYRRRQAVGQP